MMIIDKELEFGTLSVADIALRFPHAVEILNRHNLDYCCHGKKRFTQACTNANLDADSIWREIQEHQEGPGTERPLQFDTWSASLLIEFIVQHHHRYVRESIPKLQSLLTKVCGVHGKDHPSLLEVRDDFNSLAEELLNHLPKEEEFLFPAINRIFRTQVVLEEAFPLTADLQAPVSLMEYEHESAGDLIKTIRALTGDYTPPAYACPTLQLTYKLLREFDLDLMQHIHLENNVLFPKIKSLIN